MMARTGRKAAQRQRETILRMVQDRTENGPHVALYREVASLTATLSCLLDECVDHAQETGDGSALIGASALCRRIGYLADETLLAMGESQVLGGAEIWLASPAAEEALLRLRQLGAPERFTPAATPPGGAQ